MTPVRVLSPGHRVAGVGDKVYYLALSWAAVRAGLVTAVSAVPRALPMPVGGVVADR